jgi:8-oxo-dGTP pyrophosphatase MutT (NUDIX family)
VTDFAATLRAQLAVRPPGINAEWDTRPAAVLVPLYQDDAEWHLLLTERSHTVEHHKGQVAFPGGRVDVGDTSRVETALREAEEEVGLKPEHVSVLGLIDELLTTSQYRITPVVGVFPWPYPLVLSTAEVIETFGVPLRWLADPVNLEIRQRESPIPGLPVQVYYFHFPNHTIWGVTARIILNLLEVVKPWL